MCGASSQQTQVQNSEISYMQTLQSQYQTEFSQNQAILNNLNTILTPIIQAGPSQQGYSPEELATLNAQATENTAVGYRSAVTAANEEEAAKGGGNSFLPSAANQQLEDTLMSSAENQLTTQKTNILTSDFQQGNLNFNNAVGSLSSAVGAIENPLTGAAGAVTGAGNAAATEANAVNAANNSWMGLLGGIASSALGGGLSFGKGSGDTDTSEPMAGELSDWLNGGSEATGNI